MSTKRITIRAAVRSLLGTALLFGVISSGTLFAVAPAGAATLQGAWSTSTLPANDIWAGVAYGAGTWVAVNDGPTATPAVSDTAAYSTDDGATWSTATMANSEFWTSVAYGGGEFVAVASTPGEIDYSPDGINWSATSVAAGALFESVTYGNGEFVALGQDGMTGVAWYSTNGTSWTQTAIANANWDAVTYGGGTFVAVASGGNAAAYSYDGITWTSEVLSSSDSWDSVAFAPDGFFVATNGSDNTYETSATGAIWSGNTFPSAFTGGLVAEFGSSQIAFDDVGDTYSETDPYEWTTGPGSAPAGNWLNATAVNGNVMVAVPYGGTDGAIFTALTAQSINVSSTSGTFGTPLALTADGYSGTGEITYTATDDTATGCVVMAGVLTSTSAGTCLVTANIAADATYASASSTAIDVTLAPANQVISVSSLSGNSGTPLTLTASGFSGTGAITYTAIDDTATGCSVTSGVLTSTSAGTCLVTANIAADTNYNAASSAPTDVALSLMSQSIGALGDSGVSWQVGSALSATGYSGTGAITYAATDGTATGCSVTADTLYATDSGTCNVTASIAADSNYAAATSASTPVTLGLASQTITIITTSGGPWTPGLTLASAGYSGTGAISYSASDGTATGCTIAGDVLTATDVGTCDVDASIAADTQFAGATSGSTTVTLAPADQVITITSATIATTGSSVNLTAGGYHGTGAVTFSVTDGTASGCAITANALSATTAGTCIVSASIASDADYNAATSANTTVTFSAGGGGTPPIPPTPPTPPIPPTHPTPPVAPNPPVKHPVKTTTVVEVATPNSGKVTSTHSAVVIVKGKALTKSQAATLLTHTAGIAVWAGAGTDLTKVTLRMSTKANTYVETSLRNTAIGVVVMTTSKSGVVRHYKVTATETIVSGKMPPTSLFAGTNRLVIVTGGGTFNITTHRWSKYVIVIAALTATK